MTCRGAITAERFPHVAERAISSVPTDNVRWYVGERAAHNVTSDEPTVETATFAIEGSLVSAEFDLNGRRGRVEQTATGYRESAPGGDREFADHWARHLLTLSDPSVFLTRHPPDESIDDGVGLVHRFHLRATDTFPHELWMTVGGDLLELRWSTGDGERIEAQKWFEGELTDRVTVRVDSR